MLADMLTIKEKLGRLKGVKFVYMGDARYNMGNSLMIVCAKLGLHFTACTAKEYFPNEDLVNQCREWAKESGGSVTLTEDVTEGTKGAEVLYTDVWVSMGEPDEVWTERINALLPYQVNKARLIEKIAELVRDKRIDGITDLRDESDREGMRIAIELRRDVNPNIILNQLYKHTQLQDTFGVIMLALVDLRDA